MSIGDSYTLEGGFWPNAGPCPFSLSPLGEFFTQTGGPGSLNVIATASCSWSASTKADWISITSNESGVGNGVISFEARENFTGSPRQAVISISDINHFVVQDAGLGDNCNYTISPLFFAFAANGGTGFINVSAQDRCAWQAASSENWISFSGINVGIGNGRVNYSVAANPRQLARGGTIIIAGKVFAVKQKG